MRKKVSSIVLNVFLLLLGIVTVYPFIWMLCSSFKQNKEIMALQQHLLPQEFTIDNYISMNSHFNFMRFFGNSLFITLVPNNPYLPRNYFDENKSVALY